MSRSAYRHGTVQDEYRKYEGTGCLGLAVWPHRWGYRAILVQKGRTCAIPAFPWWWGLNQNEEGEGGRNQGPAISGFISCFFSASKLCK